VNSIKNTKQKSAVSKRINAEWHRNNVMPKNPTLEQRIAWHIEHAKVCGCRAIPPSLLPIINQRKEDVAKQES
jgi:hypothetical protein